MIGVFEYGSMLELGINNLVMWVDIGVVMFLLYVDNIEEFECDNECWICFDIYLDIYDVVCMVCCESKVFSQKKIKSFMVD